MPAVRDRRGADIVHELFGANLQEQGRGFYVALELLAIIRGVSELEVDDVLSPDIDVIRYRRSSHDLARRIATSTAIPEAELAQAVQGATTLETLHALLSSLIVDVPGRRRSPKWFAAHLYPFVGELVHYDAVERSRRPSIERYVFRDAGGFAHHVLRTDPDANRRERVRDGLLRLVHDSGSALGRVASALKSHDAADRPTDPFADESEAATDPRDDASPWPTTLRAGVDRIVRRPETPRAKRVEQLLHWVPYCVARHQLHLGRRQLELEPEVIPVDATTEANPLRTKSQQVLDEFRWNIVAALTSVARTHQASVADEERQLWERYTLSNASFTNSPRAFFTETLAAVGALNATVGRRHFTFRVPMLEALVSASVEPATEVEFDDFCRILAQDLRLVIDQRAARLFGLTVDIDEGVFRANALAFRHRLSAAGLLTHYSDATSLVHGEAR
jgi:hypothetical protein